MSEGIRDLDLDIRNLDLQIRDLDEEDFSPYAPPERSQFGLSLERGIYQTGASLGSGIRLLGNIPGFGFMGDAGKWLESGARAELESLAQPAEDDIVALWERLGKGEAGLSEVGDWFAYAIGSAGPSMALAMTGYGGGMMLAGRLGGLLGGGSISYLLNAGEVYSNLREQGHDSPGAAAAAGLPMAILDMAVPHRLFGRLMWTPTDKVVRGFGAGLNRMGREAGVSFFQEAATEAGQELIGAGTESLVTGKDFFTPETLSRFLNAAAAGGVAGGAFGGTFQGMAEVTRAPEQPPSLVSPTGLEWEQIQKSVIQPIDAFLKQRYTPEEELQNELETVDFTEEELGPEFPSEELQFDERLFEELGVEQDVLDPDVREALEAKIQKRFDATASFETMEELQADPFSPLFRTPKGASRLEPSTDIFTMPEETDGKARIDEFGPLYFYDTTDFFVRAGILPEGTLAQGFDYKAVQYEALPIINKEGTLTDGAIFIPGKEEDALFDDPRPEDHALTSYDPDRDATLVHPDSGEPIRTRLFDKPTIVVNSNIAMTASQFDSQKLHEMIHAEFGWIEDLLIANDQEGLARQLAEDEVNHGALFEQRQLEIAKRADMPMSSGHQLDTENLTHEVVQQTQATLKKTPSTIVNAIVDTLFGINKRSLEPRFDPLMSIIPAGVAAKAYAARLYLEELQRRKLSDGQIKTLIDKSLKRYGEDMTAAEQAQMAAQLTETLAAIQDQGTRATALVHMYTRAIDAEAQATVAERFAPEGTEILITEVESGYAYEKIFRRSKKTFIVKGVEYHLESDNVDQVKERLGHIITEEWLDANTNRAQLEQEWKEETRDDPASQTYGNWLYDEAMAGREGLEELRKRLLEHHKEAQIQPSPTKWTRTLADETRISVERLQGSEISNASESTSEMETSQESLIGLIKDLDTDIPPESTPFDPDEFAFLKSDLDRANWVQREAQTIIQFTGINKHVKTLQSFLDILRKYWEDKTSLNKVAVNTIEDWNKLGKDRMNRLTQYMLELTGQSDRIHGNQTRGRTLEVRQKELNAERLRLQKVHKLDDAQKELAERVEGELQDVAERMRQAKLALIDRNYDPEKHAEAIISEKALVNRYHDELANRFYFPMNRFGKYVTTVLATRDLTYKNKRYKTGDVVARFQYERDSKMWPGSRELEFEKVQKEFKGSAYIINKSLEEESDNDFFGFSSSAIRALETSLELTEEQKVLHKQLLIRLAPGQNFMKRELKRKGIWGFSFDGVKVYSDYMMHGANQLARLNNFSDLADTITQTSKDIAMIKRNGGNADNRIRIKRVMEESYKNLMTPGNDGALIRGYVFKHFFVANGRQLLVNLTQVPIFTYAYLADKHGDAATVRAMAGAYKDAMGFMLGNPNALSDMESRIFESAEKAGFRRQGLAIEAAAQTSGDILERGKGQNDTMRTLGKLVNAGLWPFKWSENYNRDVTILAAVRLAQKDGVTLEEDLFVAARDATNTTQFEYAAWARMPLARGGRMLGQLGPIALIFKSYTQGVIHFYSVQSNGARGRALAATLLAAGMMGLPGAEDVADIIDMFVTGIGKAFGWKDPKTDARHWLRETLGALSSPEAADLIMHGASRRTMGLGSLDLVGLPFPALDLSGSVSVGRLLPGIQPLTAQTGKPGDQAGRFISEVAGPAGALGVGFLKAVMGGNWQDWVRVMPTGLRNIMLSYDAWDKEAYTDGRGNPLLKIDTSDNVHMAELFGQALLGAPPTRLSVDRDRRWVKREAILYYTTMREMRLATYTTAHAMRDREAKADAFKAIRVYNRIAPMGLKISSRDLNRSLKARLKNRSLRLQGLPSVRRYNQFYRSFDRAFEDVEGG